LLRQQQWLLFEEKDLQQNTQGFFSGAIFFGLRASFNSTTEIKIGGKYGATLNHEVAKN
jgi:hypothetical protein